MPRPTQAEYERAEKKKVKDFFDNYVSVGDGSDGKANAHYTGLVPLGLQYYTPEGKPPRMPNRTNMHQAIVQGVDALASTLNGTVCHVPANAAVIKTYLCKTADRLGVDPINPCKDKMAAVEPADMVVWTGLIAFLDMAAANRVFQVLLADTKLKPTPEFLSVLVNVMLGCFIYPDRSIGMDLKVTHDMFVSRVRAPQAVEMMGFSKMCRVGLSYTGARVLLDMHILDARNIVGVILE